MTELRYSFLTMQSAGRGGCMPLRPALFLFLFHREVWQFFQQLHNQVLFHVLVNGHLVDHGG